MAKWAEFNENTEMDPNDIVWSEFWQSPSFGLARVGKFGPATTAQQLAANINRFFAEEQYDETLTPEETDFIWNLYLRFKTPVPGDILITCNVLNHIVNTPADQLNNINWNLFDGSLSGSDDESTDEDEFVPAQPAPSQQLLQPFPQQPATPVLSAPATGFSLVGVSSLMPGASLTTPLQAPPTAAQQFTPATVGLFQPQAPVPGGLLQSGFGQAFAAQPASTPLAEVAVHDLPYVTTVIKGLKSSDKSRLLMINIDDDGTGNKMQVGIFITAGEMPTSMINTTFSTDDYSFKDKDQKSQIHEQNKASIAGAKGLIPFNLSNGVEPTGVCAQLIRGFSVVSEGKMDQDCKPDTNKAKSIKRDGAAAIAGPSAFGMATGFPTQPGLGQAVAGQSQFGFQPTSGGFATPPTSGGFAAAAPEVAPPGTRSIQVPDFDKVGVFREAYQIPGGPHPIAVGKKIGVSPGTWYWYQLPSGAIVKSEKKYLGLLDDKSMNKKHGEKQLVRVQEVVRMMQGQYGPNFTQVAGAPASTGAVAAKSSGRGKGKTKTPPVSGGGGGFLNAGGLPAGFQPMGSVMPVQASPFAPQPSPFGQPPAPTSLPPGFQAMGSPDLPATGTTPGVLQQPAATTPLPLMAFFGAPQPVATMTPAPQAVAASPQAANPLFAAMIQNQQQAAPIPSGLFGQAGIFSPAKP